jgi:hypothetical protein
MRRLDRAQGNVSAEAGDAMKEPFAWVFAVIGFSVVGWAIGTVFAVNWPPSW